MHVGRVQLDAIDEESSVSGSDQEQLDRDKQDHRRSDEMKVVNARTQEVKQKEKKATRPAPLEILNRVTFNTSQETPRSTIKGFLNIPNQKDLDFSNDNLKKAEDQLKRAFVEFYNKLRLLKSYRYIYISIYSFVDVVLV